MILWRLGIIYEVYSWNIAGIVDIVRHTNIVVSLSAGDGSVRGWDTN
jgi:hypothetical protein